MVGCPRQLLIVGDAATESNTHMSPVGDLAPNRTGARRIRIDSAPLTLYMPLRAITFQSEKSRDASTSAS